MYFSVYDPYDEKYDVFLRDIIIKEDILIKNRNENDNEKECIICWETSNILHEVSYLQLTNIIRTTCNCNVHIHENCLCIWINDNHSCPICRTPVTVLNISFNNSTEQHVFRIWYIFLHKYKNIFYILFAYLLFLQISMFYFLVISQTNYYEISDTI